MRFAFLLLLTWPISAQLGRQINIGITGYPAVDPTNKFLINSFSGKPIFLTGDAPQLLVTQVSNADVEQYLLDRANKGYNAIWIIPFDNTYQSSPPQDFYTDVPFSGSDFTNENPTYWAHVDYVIQRAAAYGIICVFNAGFVGLNGTSGYLNSFQAASTGTLTTFGAWLGTRYKSYPNIIWMVGGDMDLSISGLSTKIAALATGIQSTDPLHLITSEACRVCSPANQSSMDAWGSPSWLALNWVYAPYASMQASCASNYARSGALPALAGEDWYELDHSMTALQLREQAYWEVLSGCTLGRLFGNEAIWTMGGPSNTSGQTWQSQLGSGGSTSEGYQGQLMRSREFWKMVPDSGNAVLTGGIGSGSTISVAACTSDGQTCIVYDPIGTSQNPVIAMGHWSGTVHAWWFNPSSGATTDLSTFTNSGSHTFTAPDGNDWVLVLDLNSANLAAPGAVPL